MSKGSLLDRIALRWHSGAAEQEEPLDFFSDLKSAQKILIAPNDRVGGLFLGAPIYKLIRQAYPQAHIGLLVDESKAAIAQQIPFVDEVVIAALDKSLWTGAFRKSQNDLQHLAFDLLFCLGGDCSFRLAILCKDSGAKLRVGFAREGVAPFNIEIIGKNPEDYEVQQYLSMLRTIGLDGDAELHWSLAQDKAEQVRTRFLGEDNARSSIIGIDLVRGEGKGLAKRQFDDVVGRVIERGAKALLFFSLAEKKTVNYLKETYGNRVILFEQNDLLASAALLESCQALIACNTDLLHLAISLQVPVVAIFTEKSARWIGNGNPAVGIVEVQDPRAATVGQIIEGLNIALQEKHQREIKSEAGSLQPTDKRS